MLGAQKKDAMAGILKNVRFDTRGREEADERGILTPGPPGDLESGEPAKRQGYDV
ncbi:hypothetical protein [Castellaniella sp.]|uniref:hypothetical protein n=1 Tax=Castellaniella sp. TaxID=1955812 RepID=UPI00355D2C8F